MSLILSHGETLYLKVQCLIKGGRRQEDGETVDAFITNLFRLAEFCDYKVLQDELIKNRIELWWVFAGFTSIRKIADVP